MYLAGCNHTVHALTPGNPSCKILYPIVLENALSMRMSETMVFKLSEVSEYQACHEKGRREVKEPGYARWRLALIYTIQVG